MNNRSMGRRVAARAVWLLCALSLFGTAVASNAAAQAQKVVSHWYVGGQKLAKNGQEAAVKCGSGVSGSDPFLFKSSYASVLIELEASGVECLSIKGSGNASITETGTSSAAFHGVLRFTGVHFKHPSTCTVNAPGTTGPAVTTITTEPLVGEIWKEASGATLYERLAPTEGTTFARFGIGVCALALKEAKIQGSTFAKTSEFGVEMSTQPFSFSAAIEKQAGGSLKLLTTAAYPANFEGSITQSLTSGLSWGWRES